MPLFLEIYANTGNPANINQLVDKWGGVAHSQGQPINGGHKQSLPKSKEIIIYFDCADRTLQVQLADKAC
jgi:hypothetical protein